MKKISLLTFLLGSFFLLQAQPYTKHIAPIDNEKWWGCFVGIGNEMPFASNTPLYDLAKVINSDDARGGLVSHTELGVTRNWGQTGKKDIELALAKIPPKTYVGLLRRDGNA